MFVTLSWNYDDSAVSSGIHEDPLIHREACFLPYSPDGQDILAQIPACSAIAGFRMSMRGLANGPLPFLVRFLSLAVRPSFAAY
jgi:hypothetical protein